MQTTQVEQNRELAAQRIAQEQLAKQKKREKKPHRFVFHPVKLKEDPSISRTSDGSIYKADENGTLRRLNKGMNKKERRKQREQSLQRPTVE